MVLSKSAKAIRSTYEPEADDPWWKDNSAHFLSGAVIATVAVPLMNSAVTVFGVYLALAAIWEAYEYKYNIRPWDEREDWSLDRAIEDTLLDTIMGGAGVAVVLIVA